MCYHFSYILATFFLCYHFSYMLSPFFVGILSLYHFTYAPSLFEFFLLLSTPYHLIFYGVIISSLSLMNFFEAHGFAS
jgi:hypothetical protein